MDEEGLAYIGLTSMVMIALVLTAGSYGAFSIVILALGLLAIVVNVTINYADFIIFPLFTRIFGITTVPAGRYRIPKSQDVIIKYVNGIYYATGYLTGNVYSYVFTSEQTQDDQTVLAGAMEKWERIVMNADFPFKMNVVAVPQGVQQYRDEIDGQRGYLEFQLSREVNGSNPNQMVVQELQRKLGVLQAKMDRISAGERPLNTIIYIESTAVGISEKEAVDNLSTQLSQLQTLFNSFDLSISRVIGRELYYLNVLNYRVFSEAELGKIFQVQR